MHNCHVRKFQKAFALPSDSFTTAVDIKMREPLIRAVAQLDEKGQILKSKTSTENPVSSLMKKKFTAFARSPFRIYNWLCINNNATVIGA